MQKKSQNNQQNMRPSCPNGYACHPFFFETKFNCYHTQADEKHRATYRSLSSKYASNQSGTILGYVELRNDVHEFIPIETTFKKDCSNVRFLLSHPEPEKVPQDRYYEAKFKTILNKTGHFYVLLIDVDKHWGKKDDVDHEKRLWLRGQGKIFNEFEKGNFEKGILNRKHDGSFVIKANDRNYVISDQNRAFPKSEVKFRQIIYENKVFAEIVAIQKCSVAHKDLYGILIKGKFRDIDKYYYPFPKIDWNSNDPLKEILDVNPAPNGEMVSAIKFMLNRRAEFNEVSSSLCFFVPIDPTLPIFVCWNYRTKLDESPNLWRSYVKAKFTEWPINSEYPFVKLTEVVGEIGDPNADARVILWSNGVTTDNFPPEITKESKKIKEKWEEKMEEAIKSEELTDATIFTIDNSSTQCRDDALSIKKISKNEQDFYEIGIHISDPSRIIAKNTAIYREAKSRYQSTYIGKSFQKPIIPYDLQNLLSLQQNQLRYALSVYVCLNEKGELCKKETRFESSVIKPTANLSYAKIDAQLKDPTKPTIQSAEIAESLISLQTITKKLNEVRKNLGISIDLNDESESDQNSSAHIMVAELMILANEVTTDYISNAVGALKKQLQLKRKAEQELAKVVKKDKEETKTIEPEITETPKPLPAEKPEQKKEIQTKDEIKPEICEIKQSLPVEKKPKENIKPVETESEKIESSDYSESEEEKENENDNDDLEEEDSSESDDEKLDLNKIEANGAVTSCNFVKQMWKSVDRTKELDLTKDKNFAKSVEEMMKDESILLEVKVYLKHLLKLNNRQIRLYIKNKLYDKTQNAKEQKKKSKESDSESEDQEEKKIETPEKSDAEIEKVIEEPEDSDDKEEEKEDSEEKEGKQGKKKSDGQKRKAEKKTPKIKTEQKPELVFDLKATKKLMKAFNNCKESEKMKFTSPLRKFHDMMVHGLIKEILSIEEKISKIDETVTQQLSNDKTGKMKRAGVFNKLAQAINQNISGIEKIKKEMKKLFDEKIDFTGRGMAQAEREIEIMEVCKSIIAEKKKILADAVVVKMQREVKVFLPNYSIECSIVIPRNQKVQIFDVIEVFIKVKDTFPLNYQLEFIRKKEKDEPSKLLEEKKREIKAMIAKNHKKKTFKMQKKKKSAKKTIKCSKKKTEKTADKKIKS